MAERPELPLLSAEVLIGQGAAADPAGLAGTAMMTGELLTKGTETMTAPQIANAIESLGGTIGSGAGRETSAAYIQVISVKAEPALRILADVVLHPAFRQEEIDRLRNQRLDYLRVVLQQPGSLARFVTERVVFGSGAYGHDTDGTLETLQMIGRDEIVKLYQADYLPREAAFILAGDMTLGQGRDIRRKTFGDWKNVGGGPNEKSFRGGGLEAARRGCRYAGSRPGRSHGGEGRRSRAPRPDYYARWSQMPRCNGFVSRLNREIRIKRGLSYGAGSSFEARRQPGLFSATVQTKTNRLPSRAAGQRELKRMVTDPVEGAELQARKAVLTGRYARNLETTMVS